MKLWRFAICLFSVICMIIIFHFSAQPSEESNQLSKSVTQKVVELSPKASHITEKQKQNTIKIMNGRIRKYAHFTMFCLLGILTSVAFHSFMRNTSLWKVWVLSLAFCLLYALLDETHQIFVPGRGAQGKDVLIDFCGSLLGSSVVMSAGYIIRRFKHQTV